MSPNLEDRFESNHLIGNSTISGWSKTFDDEKVKIVIHWYTKYVICEYNQVMDEAYEKTKIIC